MGQTLGASSCSSSALASPPAPERVPAAPVAAVAELCFAAGHGDQGTARKLLAEGLDVNVVDYDRRSALHIAASDGQHAMVEFLIGAKANVNMTDRWGHTALDEAVRGQFENVQKILQAAGAQEGVIVPPPVHRREIEASREVGTAPKEIEAAMLLCCAAGSGSLPLVQELHAGGTKLDAADYDGRTALHVAAAHGHLEMVQWLMSMKANVNNQDSFGLTPLSEALRLGRDDVAEELIKRGADSADLKEVRLEAMTGQWAIPAKELEIGTVLGKTLKSVIYRATWRGTQVVAKTCSVLTKSESGSTLVEMVDDGVEEPQKVAAAQEVIHEIRLLSTLRHPDLVMFLGACFDHKTPFFITEFMEGGDLERYYATQERRTGYPFRPPGATLIKWTSAVARALCFLHNCARPIIHRDLKPLNLLLTANAEVKVTDFGISKLMAPRALDGATGVLHAKPLMSGGVGTWRYMAPEIVRYEQYTDRVDIYSFALIMWFMCTGLQPFVEQFGKDAELVLKDYLKGHEPRPKIASVSTRCGRFAPALRQLIQDCWHNHPESRPSAEECTRRLAHMCAEGGGALSSFPQRLSGLFTRPLLS